jgi:GT2 family glycosyltransferase
VERLLRHAKVDPTIGVVVPATNWAGNEAKINVDYTDASEMEEFALSLARKNLGRSLEIEVAPFFCALVSRAVWEKVGELDERFEVGMFEDDDFSLRVRRSNYRIVVAEDSFVHHFGSASFSKLPPSRYQQIFETNLQRFESKWGIQWVPHRYRPETRLEHLVFDPAVFCRGGT